MIDGRTGIRTLLFLSATAIAGCGAAAGDALTADELDAVRESGSSTSVAHQSMVIADSLFDFDPTIDPTLSAEQNATAIRDRIQSQSSGCGTISLAGTTLTVNFGAAPGCTLANGVTASGSLTAGVSKSGSTITVALSFASLVVNGKALDGTASFATSNGSTFAVTAALTSGADTINANLTVTGASGSFTMGGTASSSRSSMSATFTAVTYRAGDCYPNGGSMALTRGPVSLTVTFSASSANSGVVTVTQGRRSSSATLPAYGTCPR